MAELPLAFAFTAGLFAVFNPCGFAMLPAYLGRFAGVDSARPLLVTLSRAVVTTVAVTAGWAGLFGVVAFAVRAGGIDVLRHSPWLTMVIGLLLAVIGVATVAGRRIGLRAPRLDHHVTGTRSMVVYGAAYAVVSLGCTLPTFLAYVAGTMATRDVASGIAVFVAYVAGFAVLLGALTVSVACAGSSLASTMRSWIPTVERLSGVLLVLAGSYVAYYGWYELSRLGDPDPVVDRVTAWSSRLQLAVDDIGPLRLGTALTAILVVTIGVLLAARRRPTPDAATTATPEHEDSIHG